MSEELKRWFNLIRVCSEGRMNVVFFLVFLLHPLPHPSPCRRPYPHPHVRVHIHLVQV